MKSWDARTARFGFEALESRTLFAGAPVVTVPVDTVSPNIADSLTGCFPPFLNSGTLLKTPAVLRITNRTGVPLSGTINTTLVFSTDAVADASDTPVVTVSTNVNLKLGTIRRINLKPSAVPTLPNGTYRLLAVIERPGAVPETIACTRTYTVASPLAELRLDPPVISLGKGRRSLGPVASASVQIENIGDGLALGKGALTLYAQSQTGQRIPLTVARTVSLNLQRGRTLKVNVTFNPPPGIEPGIYSLVAELSPRAIATTTTQPVVATSLTTFRV
jgi:hypothetical protein